MDKLNSADEIKALYEEMMLDYAVRMKSYHEKQTDFSPKFLLSYNEYSCTDIAEYLGFSGESHFSALFKKYEGITPKEYRKKTYNKTFTNLG